MDAPLVGGRPLPHPAPHLADIALHVGSMQEATDLRDLFAALARSVVQAINCEACVVSLYDEGRDVLYDFAASAVPPYRLNSLVEEYSLDDFPETKRVMTTARPVEISVSDPAADHGEKEYLREVGAQRVLITRLTVEGRGIGIVESYRIEDRPFRKDDPRQVDLLVSFAANAYSRIQLASRLESHYTETIEALVSALEARDPATQAHTGRIRDIAIAVGVSMDVPSDVLRSVRLGAILHDVGKIGISDAILTKPGPLTDEEWEIMRAHPIIGERMLQGVAFLEPVLPVVRHHHERWDGRGYPDGLAGENIPLAARIVAACDAFDAMTSDRPYRSALPIEVACRELLDCTGTQFDPNVARTLIEVVGQMTGEDELETKFLRYAV
jgi:HD-GYP domain-containing protein (c-di-GMP phosphodiesterase class II)